MPSRKSNRSLFMVVLIQNLSPLSPSRFIIGDVTSSLFATIATTVIKGVDIRVGSCSLRQGYLNGEKGTQTKGLTRLGRINYY